MKKIKQLKKWGIYELSTKEKSEYNFNYAVIHPDIMESVSGGVKPSDTDWECNNMEEAIDWIKNY